MNPRCIRQGTSMKLDMQNINNLPYMQELPSFDKDYPENWFPHGSDLQKLHVSVAYEKAKQSRLCVEELAFGLCPHPRRDVCR